VKQSEERIVESTEIDSLCRFFVLFRSVDIEVQFGRKPKFLRVPGANSLSTFSILLEIQDLKPNLDRSQVSSCVFQYRAGFTPNTTIEHFDVASDASQPLLNLA